MQRMQTLLGHLGPAAAASVSLHTTAAAGTSVVAPSPRQMVESGDDIVVVSARRTPIGKAKRGSFKVFQVKIHMMTQKTSKNKHTKLDKSAKLYNFTQAMKH